MACGCGRKIGSLERPLVAGRPNGADPVEMHLRTNMGGARAGRDVWVTGDGIQQWIDLELADLIPV